MTRQITLNQTTARQILEGLFGEDNVKMLKHWKFAIRHYYFYRPAGRLAGFTAKVEKELAEVKGWKILETYDAFREWPELSFFEVTILVEDAAAFFEGPTPKEEAIEEPAAAPEPEVTPEPAAVAEPATNLFNLASTYQDRKAWRRAIRNLAADLNAAYTNENGCYYLVLEDGTYEFSLTEAGSALVALLPATVQVL